MDCFFEELPVNPNLCQNLQSLSIKMSFSDLVIDSICELKNLKCLELVQFETFTEEVDFEVICANLLNLESLKIIYTRGGRPLCDDYDNFAIDTPSNIGNLINLKQLCLINVIYDPSISLKYIGTLQNLEECQIKFYYAVLIVSNFIIFKLIFHEILIN